MHGYMNDFFGHMWIGWLFWVVVVGLIVWAVFFLAGRSSAGKQANDPQETALEILEKRYARGEISRQEFDEKKETLKR